MGGWGLGHDSTNIQAALGTVPQEPSVGEIAVGFVGESVGCRFRFGVAVAANLVIPFAKWQQVRNRAACFVVGGSCDDEQGIVANAAGSRASFDLLRCHLFILLPLRAVGGGV